MLLYVLPAETERLKRVNRRARQLLKEGNIIYYPTDTLPGLLAWARDRKAVENVFKAKKRPPGNPLPIGVSGVREMLDIIDVAEENIGPLREFIPGPLTVVGPLKKDVELPEGVVKGGEVAVRVPGYRPLLELLREISPLTLTSANIHGCEPLFSPSNAAASLGGDVKYYFVDYHHHYMKTPSTVIRFEKGSLEVLREGAIKANVIRERLHGQGSN